MRKLAAIIIAIILVFNWAGYRAVFSYLESLSSRSLNHQLDNSQYDESSLVTIKVPVDQLPYYTNSPIFERVKGDITIGGVRYQYVEKRIYNDSIEMRCIPNNEVTHLTNARDEFFQLVNDLQHTSSSGKKQPAGQNLSFKNLLSDYLLDESFLPYQPVFHEKAKEFILYSAEITSQSYSPQEQPPDRA